MSIYYSDSGQLDIFFNKLKETYKVFSPVAKEPDDALEIDYYYQPAAEAQTLIFNPYRTIEPLKSFFTYPYEKLTTYFINDADKDTDDVIDKTSFRSKGGSANRQPKNFLEDKTIVFGVKNCDIAAQKIQDFVFLEGVEVDTLYQLKRENTILVSGDCTGFRKTCHCLGWEILPYPTEGFDLNLSPLSSGYIVEAFSKKAEELIHEYKQYFVLAKESQVFARKTKRENFIERLKKHIAAQGLVSKDAVQGVVRRGYNLDTWQQFMLSCVECGACNLICNSCHCFLLADERKDLVNKKVRLWDSCQYINFSRVAGGANPLKTRAKRLRNRFMKKFDFFVDNLGTVACCGCGRCIEACPAKIDIREVLKDLAKKLAVIK